MNEIKAFHPPDAGDDAHIVRRLGWAVVRQWHMLPQPVRDRIASQANFTEDEYQTVQLNEQIGVFLRKHAPENDS